MIPVAETAEQFISFHTIFFFSLLPNLVENYKQHWVWDGNTPNKKHQFTTVHTPRGPNIKALTFSVTGMFFGRWEKTGDPGTQ